MVAFAHLHELRAVAERCRSDEDQRRWLRILADSVGAEQMFVGWQQGSARGVMGTSGTHAAETVYLARDGISADIKALMPVPQYRIGELAECLDPVSRLIERTSELMDQHCHAELAIATSDASGATSVTRFYYVARPAGTASQQLAARLVHRVVCPDAFWDVGDPHTDVAMRGRPLQEEAEPREGEAHALASVHRLTLHSHRTGAEKHTHVQAPSDGEAAGAAVALSEFELRVLHDAVTGRSNEQIAADLGRSRQTIERVITSLRQTLGARTKQDLIRVASRRGLLQSGAVPLSIVVRVQR